MRKYFQVSWSLKEALALTMTPVAVLALINFGLNSLGLDEQISAFQNQSLVRGGLFLLQSIIILAPLLIWSHTKHQSKGSDYGFKKVKVLKTIEEVLLHYFLFLGITAIVGIIIIFTDLKIPGYQAQPSIIPAFGTDPLSLAIMATIMIVVAPIVEEIFFRGFILRTLVKHYDQLLGSVATAAIFAIFHLQMQSIIPIFILGLILNSIVIRNKSIWPAICFHALNNAIAFAIQLAILTKELPVDALFS